MDLHNFKLKNSDFNSFLSFLVRLFLFVFSPHVRESGKFLLMESGIREILACGIWNPGNFCWWNLGSGKFLLKESGIREIFAWNPEYWGLDSGIHFKESGIPLTI